MKIAQHASSYTVSRTHMAAAISYLFKPAQAYPFSFSKTIFTSIVSDTELALELVLTDDWYRHREHLLRVVPLGFPPVFINLVWEVYGQLAAWHVQSRMQLARVSRHNEESAMSELLAVQQARVAGL